MAEFERDRGEVLVSAIGTTKPGEAGGEVGAAVERTKGLDGVLTQGAHRATVAFQMV